MNDAGYDLVHDYDGVFETFDKVIGLDQIAVFHINDSLNPLGAHKDRHANIGKGTIGFEPLYRLVHDPRFVEIPKILETPWLCAEGETKKTTDGSTKPAETTKAAAETTKAPEATKAAEATKAQ